jgi:hypothetical protein
MRLSERVRRGIDCACAGGAGKAGLKDEGRRIKVRGSPFNADADQRSTAERFGGARSSQQLERHRLLEASRSRGGSRVRGRQAERCRTGEADGEKEMAESARETHSVRG